MDISALLKGDAESVRNEFLYYAMTGRIEGIREGDWKLLIKQPGGKNAPQKANAKPTVMLFNLATDLGEQTNLASEKPDLVERLQKRMNELNAAIEAEARPAWKQPEA
jgi:arylsulfatase A-like enzyme